MKVIGIIGGLGPESTVDYYQRLVRGLRQPGSLATPEIVIYSVSLEEVLDLVARREWNHLIYLLSAKVKALHRAGADLAVISANTPHVVFDEVRAKSPIPMLSIVTATGDRAAALGLKKPGLLGTRFTMEENFFAPAFFALGMSVVVPPEDDRNYIHDKLMTQIELGVFKEETREGLLSIVRRMIERDAIDSVILGCTELPLILEGDAFGIPFLNTTAIHIDSVVEYCSR